jgi:hypothetical protein
MAGPACNPNGAGLPNWPACNDAHPQMLHIASGGTKAGPIVSQDGLKALDEYFAWRRASDAQPAAVGR